MSPTPTFLCPYTRGCLRALTRVGWFRFATKNKTDARVSWALLYIEHWNQKAKYTQSNTCPQPPLSRAPTPEGACGRSLDRVGWFRFTTKNMSAVRVSWALFYIEHGNQKARRPLPALQLKDLSLQFIHGYNNKILPVSVSCSTAPLASPSGLKLNPGG